MSKRGAGITSERKNYITDMILTALAVICFLSLLHLIHPLYFMKGDNIMSYNSYFKYSFEAMISGRLPLYNFRQNLGYPFLAMGQTGSLDPFVFIAGVISRFILGSDAYILTVMVFIYLPLAAVFMYPALRELQTGRTASVICSVCWALNSFTVYYGRVWMIVIQVSCWLPLMLLCDMKLIRSGKWHLIPLAALPRVLLFYAGHPQFFMFGVVFESLFVFFFIAADKELSGNKLRTFGRYVISFVPMVFMVLPLLLPMWQVMSSSSDRSSALDLTTFLEKKYIGDEYITGALFPFFSTDGFEVMNNTEEIGGCLNHFGYVPLFATLAVFISYILKVAGKKARFRVPPVIAGTLAASAVAVLWSSSTLFNKFLYMIPVVNRFRWPFKAALFAVFYFVVTGAYCLGKLTGKENRPASAKRVTGIVLLAVTVVNFAVLYMVVPPKYQGIYVDGDLNERPSYFSLFEHGRYVTVGFPAHVYDDETSRQVPGYVRELNYNMATYYGFENFSGYGGVLSAASASSESQKYTIMDFSGSICGPDEGFIGQMRSLGVELYVVSRFAGFDQDPQGSFLSEQTGAEVCSFLEDHGMTLLYSEDSFRIYKDPQALPVVYHENGGAVQPLSHDTDINSITLSTDASFEGGTVNVEYNFHKNFAAYIDGSEAVLSCDPLRGTMRIEVPSGSHDVRIVYKDDLFVICIAAALAGTAVSCFGCRMLYGRRVRTGKDGQKDNG